MATREWVESAAHEHKPSPSSNRLVLDWIAGKTERADQDDARVERWVKRRFNTHGCRGKKCRKPGHDEDVDACRTVLQALGFMPTPVAEAVDATGRRRSVSKPYGRCPVCRRFRAVKKSGVMGAHYPSDMSREHCVGEDRPPVGEAS